jgi:von Willebrand factor type D domain
VARALWHRSEAVKKDARPAPESSYERGRPVDLRKTRTSRPRVSALFAIVATVPLLANSAVATAQGGTSPAAFGVARPIGSTFGGHEVERHAPVQAVAASATVAATGSSDFTSIFVPPPTLPVPVKAPSVEQAAAFTALNALLATETRFGEAIIAMRVALDRAQAATSAGAQLWVVRQANASAEYALSASSQLVRFPALQAAVVKAFVADGMSVTLTPEQIAAAKAKFLHRLPVSLKRLLAVAAAPYQPTTVPEVAALRAAILDTVPLEQAVAHASPRTLVLPAAFASSSVIAAEARLSAALKDFANTVLQPVPESALGALAGRFVPSAECFGEEDLAEALEGVSDAFDAMADANKFIGGEAAEAAAESLEPIGTGAGYLYAIIVFYKVGAAFNNGAGEGGGGGGSGGGGSGGGGSGGGGSGGNSGGAGSGGAGSGGAGSGGEGSEGCGGGGEGNAASAGDPHQMTFSGADYDFQASGEFTLVKSTTDDLEIQIRQQPFPGAASVAVDTATAMQVSGTIVELAVNASGDLQLWVNRNAVPYASRTLSGGGKLSVQTPWSAKVTWPDGTAVTVFTIDTTASPHHVLTCNSKHAINLIVTVPQSRFGHLEGLLGDPGAPPGELVGSNGTTYNVDELAQPWQSVHNFDLLYHQFGQSWRVSQQNSLFYYPKGASAASFTDPAFPSRALTVSSLTPTTVAAAKRDCKAEGVTNSDLLADCIYDTGLSGAQGTCFAGAEARVQAATGGPSAIGLPDSSGAVSTTSNTASPATPAGVPTTGAWLRISGGTNNATAVGSQLGLARTAGGTLNVVWDRGTSKATILDTRISSGGTIMGTTTVATNWAGLSGLALVPGAGNTLQLFAGGGSTGSIYNGINTFTAPAAGAPWALVPKVSWGGIPAGDSPYLGATVAPNAQAVTAWPGSYHVGLNSSATVVPIDPDMESSELVTDQKTGAVVVAGVTIAGSGGTFVRRLLPVPGPVMLLPSSTNVRSSGAAARTGGGVYIAWANGSGQAVELSRYGGASRTVAQGAVPGGGLGWAAANVFAAPGGRLWVVWWADRSNYLFVTRSNAAVSAFEPVQRLVLPDPSTDSGIVPGSQIQGDATTGPLDLFADTIVGNQTPETGFLYTRVGAMFTLHESVGTYPKGARTAPVKFTVLDAGDPLQGVQITVGHQHELTGASGSVTLQLAPGGSYKASATAPGYVPGLISFLVPAST